MYIFVIFLGVTGMLVFSAVSVSSVMRYSRGGMLLEKYACTVVPKRLEGRRSNFPRRLSVSAASIPGGSARYEGMLLTRAGFLASSLLVSAGVC